MYWYEREKEREERERNIFFCFIRKWWSILYSFTCKLYLYKSAACKKVLSLLKDDVWFSFCYFLYWIKTNSNESNFSLKTIDLILKTWILLEQLHNERKWTHDYIIRLNNAGYHKTSIKLLIAIFKVALRN